MFTTEKRGTILDMTCIHERPVEVDDRIISGNWEGDLIVGKGHKSVIRSDVEHNTRTFLYVATEAKACDIS
jgi:IS30 family transposase